MGEKKTLRLILNVLIVIFFLGFLLGLLYFLHGSLEMFPTEEQQDKAKLAAVLIMAVMGILSITIAVVRAKIGEGMGR